MSDRIAVLAMAILTAAVVVLAPWGAVNRETGARSAVVLLPQRYVDFTGRTAAVDFPAGNVVLGVTALGVLLAAGGALAGGRARHGLWLAAAVALIGVTTWGLGRLGGAVDDARAAAVRAEVERAAASPTARQDPDVLREALAAFDERSLQENLAAARAGGLNIRRLPYTNVGPGLSAFLAIVLGLVTAVAGLRAWERLRRGIDVFLRGGAVPAISILLALGAAAVVILLLQPTPVGSGVELSAFERLVGRLDTLWYAYYTMFHDALGTVGGFAESLKLMTPLVFTGLAVAFGFQAGLFNIGAPGQMVLGAIGAAMVALYLPGPRIVAMPAAILGAFAGGALWGALPGWLKARFGANEVITTILLNFVAASVLLFILSSSNVFAAAALRILAAIGIVAAVALALLVVPPVRRAVRRSPRLMLAVLAVVVIGASIYAAQPRPGDAPVTVQMPFKVPGNEPKSQPLRVAARLPQLPAMVGIDTRTSPGVNVVRIDYARLLAPLVAVAAFFALGRYRALRRWPARLLAAAGVGVAAYLLGVLVGLNRLPTAIPPTNLNASFFIAVLVAVLVYVLLFKTRFGFELRAVGLAPGAAEYAGANIPRTTVITMALSGGLAGLTATHYVLGGALEDYALRQSIPTSDGFDGIAVALLAGNHPIGILLSALLFGVMKYGGSVLNITFPNLTREVVSMILALVVLFIAARGFLPQSFVNPAFRRRFTHAGQRDTVEGEEAQPLAQQAGEGA